MLNIWESNIKQNKDLQLVVPMIIYHGESEWKKREMNDYFISNDNWLFRFLPDFDYLLTDLSSYTDSQIEDGTFKRAAIEIGLLMGKGIEKGTLIEKKEVLINLISKKFGVSDDDRLLITAIEDKIKLDLTLDEILFAESKDVLMDILR